MNKELCPVCKKSCGTALLNDGRDYFIFDGDSDVFTVRFCAECQVAYSTPFLNDSELSKYYPESFEAYQPKKSLMAFIQSLKYGSDLKLIRNKFSVGGSLSLFEIGAGRGAFLAEAMRKSFSVEGAEPGEAGRRCSIDQYGIKLSSEYASKVNFKKQYDIVVLRHVLEHLGDPIHILERIFTEGLRHGGWIFLKLPKVNSWEARVFGRFWHGYDLPRHRLHYSDQGIKKVLDRVGFKNVEVRQEVVPTDTMRSLYYCSRHDSPLFLKIVSKIFVLLPSIFQLAICQISSILVRPFGAGRMIVMAQKN